MCFGWIDGVRRSLGEDAYSIRFTPRKTNSIWSIVNVARAQSLIQTGKMTSAGLIAFEKRTPERTGIYSFERNAPAKLTREEDEKLRTNTKAATFSDSQPPWYQRAAIHWVISAKRTETRQRRLEQLIRDSSQSRTIPLVTRPARVLRTRDSILRRGPRQK